MEKTYFIILLLSFINYSCSNKIEEFGNNIDKKVNEAEIIVTSYDIYVQNAITNNQLLQIAQYSKESTAALDNVLEGINQTEAPKNGTDLKESATEYVKNLQKFVQSQEVYSTYNDSITEVQADSLDLIVKKVFDEADRKHKLYLIKKIVLTKK